TAVVLPAPFGPRTPSTVPCGTVRSIPRSARTSPNDLVRPSTRIAGPEVVCDCDTHPPEQAGSPSNVRAPRTLPAALPYLRPKNPPPAPVATVPPAPDIHPVCRPGRQNPTAPPARTPTRHRPAKFRPTRGARHDTRFPLNVQQLAEAGR